MARGALALYCRGLYLCHFAGICNEGGGNRGDVGCGGVACESGSKWDSEAKSGRENVSEEAARKYAQRLVGLAPCNSLLSCRTG
jgi:hypothetical protein